MMEDLISRQKVIEALETVGYDFSESELSEVELEEVCGAVSDVRQDMVDRIKQLPSAQPERGKWIKISPANIYECSECGKGVMTNDICAYDFCHGCGAKMDVTT